LVIAAAIIFSLLKVLTATN